MTNEAISKLADVAAKSSSLGASEFLRVKNLTADPEALAAALKRHVAAAMNEALDDARDAIACGMLDAAVQTFHLSMVQAGIDAAKEVTAPVPGAAPAPVKQFANHLKEFAPRRIHRHR